MKNSPKLNLSPEPLYPFFFEIIYPTNIKTAEIRIPGTIPAINKSPIETLPTTP